MAYPLLSFAPQSKKSTCPQAVTAHLGFLLIFLLAVCFYALSEKTIHVLSEEDTGNSCVMQSITFASSAAVKVYNFKPTVAYDSDAGYTQCTKDVYTFLEQAKVITVKIGTSLPWDFGEHDHYTPNRLVDGKSYTIVKVGNTKWTDYGATRNEATTVFTFAPNTNPAGGMTGEVVPNDAGLRQSPGKFYLHGEIHYASGARGVSLMFTFPVTCETEDGDSFMSTCKTYAWLNSKDTFVYYPAKIADYSRLKYKQSMVPEDTKKDEGGGVTHEYRIGKVGKLKEGVDKTTGTKWHTIGFPANTEPTKDAKFTRNENACPEDWYEGSPKAYQQFDEVSAMKDGTTKAATTTGGFGSFAPKSGAGTTESPFVAGNNLPEDVYATAMMQLYTQKSEALSSWFNPIKRKYVDPLFSKVTEDKLQDGVRYTITSTGTNPDFTAKGAPNNNLGTVFTATGAGTGTGIAQKKGDFNDPYFMTGGVFEQIYFRVHSQFKDTFGSQQIKAPSVSAMVSDHEKGTTKMQEWVSAAVLSGNTPNVAKEFNSNGPEGTTPFVNAVASDGFCSANALNAAVWRCEEKVKLGPAEIIAAVIALTGSIWTIIMVISKETCGPKEEEEEEAMAMEKVDQKSP